MRFAYPGYKSQPSPSSRQRWDRGSRGISLVTVIPAEAGAHRDLRFEASPGCASLTQATRANPHRHPGKGGIEAVAASRLSLSFRRKLEPIVIFASRQAPGALRLPGLQGPTLTVIAAKVGIEAVAASRLSPSFRRKLEPIVIFASRQAPGALRLPGLQGPTLTVIAGQASPSSRRRPGPGCHAPCGWRRKGRPSSYPPPMSPAACPC